MKSLMPDRPSRDQVFMLVARAFALRSTCPRAHVGAVIVQENRIVSTGYNGALPDQPHCTDVGCEVKGISGCTRAMHAEANAVAFAARQGVPIVSGTMYCTHSTCVTCARLIASAGIGAFVYMEPYRLTEGIRLLQELGIEVMQLAKPQAV